MSSRQDQKPSPAFQFYPAEWLSSDNITLMTPAQEGAYIRLLCYAWNEPDCSIPDNDEQLAVLSRLGEGWFNGGSSVVRKCFVPHKTKSGRLVNLRLLEERKKQETWRRKSSEGGRKSAEQRRKAAKGGSTTVPTKSPPPVEPMGNSLSSSLSLSSNKNNTLIQDLGNNQFMGSESISAEQVQPHARARKRPAKSHRDERTNQPAIQLVRELMNRYPPKATWDEIISALGAEPDRARLQTCWVEWNKRGFKPNNLAWLFHWYRNGVPAAGPPGNGNGKGKGPTKEELLAAHYAFIERHSNGQNTGSEQILGDVDSSTGDVREKTIL